MLALSPCWSFGLPHPQVMHMVPLLPSEPFSRRYPDEPGSNRPAADGANAAPVGALARGGRPPAGRLGRPIRAATAVVARAFVRDARAPDPRAAGVARERTGRLRPAARSVARV